MKKLVLSILIVIGIVFVLDFSVGKVLRRLYFKEAPSTGQDSQITYSIDSAKSELLIFGESTALDDYMPNVFEDSLKMSFYTTGIDGATNIFEVLMLKAALKRYTPKMIILSLSAYRDYFEKEKGNNNEYDKLSVLLPYYNTHEEIRDTLLKMSIYERVKLLSQIYPFNSRAMSIIKGNCGPLIELERREYPAQKGHIYWTKTLNTKLGSQPTVPFIMDSVKLGFFNDFLLLAKKSGIKVFVVFPPVFAKFSTEAEEVVACRNICSKENIPCWDFSQDSLFLSDNSFFSDLRHLNTKGAIIFSQMIAHKMDGYVNKKNSNILPSSNTGQSAN